MTLCFDLPFPVSTNDLWAFGKSGRVRRSDQYRAWIDRAGWEIQRQKHWQKAVAVSGHFHSSVVLSEKERKRGRDLDNYGCKAILDLLQKHRLIDNDNLHDEMSMAWGEAPAGCKVFVWPSDGEPFQ